MHGRYFRLVYDGDRHNLKPDAAWEELELAIATSVCVISCLEDGVFELSDNVTVGEDEDKEGGGWLIYPLGVLELALDAHAASKANEAVGWNGMFPVDLPRGRLACSVDEPSEVAGDFNIIFHFHLLVMVWDDTTREDLS